MFWRSLVWRSGLIATAVGITLLLLLTVSTAHGAEHPRANENEAVHTRAAEKSKSAHEATIDLNHATLEQLMTLPGVGASKARAIMEQREKRPFQRVSDLMRIKGFGRRTFLRLKPYLRVGPTPTATHTPVQES